MFEHYFFENDINNIINDINDTIDNLYLTEDCYEKNKLLNNLRRQITIITMLIHNNQINLNTSIQAITQNDPRVFTPEELSTYTGKNGNPAYVAVNGVVYDMTNVAAWGGATHFGLTPGKDFTGVFESCHNGQPILSSLPVVGVMAP